MTRNYMFRVADENDDIVEVYWVKENKNGYPIFLIRNHKTNQWLWKSAKHFKSINEWVDKMEAEYY